MGFIAMSAHIIKQFTIEKILKIVKVFVPQPPSPLPLNRLWFYLSTRFPDPPPIHYLLKNVPLLISVLAIA